MKKPLQQSEKAQNILVVAEDDEGQRLDNYLTNNLKTVPKSHIYKLIRTGQVRVNSRRVTAKTRILTEDVIRLPPNIQLQENSKIPPSHETTMRLQGRILYEDENLLVLNKPSGMSVHAGSTVRVGVIEAMRHLDPKYRNLELAHRLDSETSGCLILAKKKRILRELHELLRAGRVKKTYYALTKGEWQHQEVRVDLPLRKFYAEGGRHLVRVQHEGKSALTVFKQMQTFGWISYVQAILHTGRTHQIRVHALAKNHPLACDDRYGDPEFNKRLHHLGLKRMFLHASAIEFTLPSNNQHIKVTAPLDVELESILQRLQKDHSQRDVQ